jgi:16S rRNA (guanine966-N2)-methyltransferase
MNDHYASGPAAGSRREDSPYTDKMRKPRHAASGTRPKRPGETPVVGLRIIGGSLRGRKLQYSGDVRTRPMKDRVREAVFNLIGPRIVGTHAIDLFAGTGALGLEAISRGAVRATLIERHLPTLELIKQNAAALGVAERACVVFGDAFHWSKSFVPAGDVPLVVFCSPPYEFYQSRSGAMLELIERFQTTAPPASALVVEADEHFDFQLLPQPQAWDVRTYPPAIVGLYVS